MRPVAVLTLPGLQADVAVLVLYLSGMFMSIGEAAVSCGYFLLGAFSLWWVASFGWRRAKAALAGSRREGAPQ